MTLVLILLYQVFVRGNIVSTTFVCFAQVIKEMQLYYSPFSQPSNAVRLLIFSSNLDKEFEFIPVTLEVLKSDEFAKINPLKQVPVLVDSGATILESAAIMEYICQKWKLEQHWLPSEDLLKRAKVSEYLHYHHSHLRKGAGAFYKTYFVQEEMDIDPELAAIEDALKHIESHFLKDSKFIGGEDVR